MNLFNRLSFHKGREKTPIASLEALDQDLNQDPAADRVFLWVDGKTTHRLEEKDNKSPRDIDEIGTKVLVLVPLTPWRKVCEHAKVYKPGAAVSHDPDNEGGIVPSSLILFSAPYDHGGRGRVLEDFISTINSHMETTLKLIAEANKDRGNRER